jgi:DNA gyrase subunit A
MQSLLDLQQGEKVGTILPLRDLEEEGKYIFFATRQGTVKKTPLKDFSNVMARGIIAIGVGSKDELVAARLTDGNQIVFLATHLGLAIRFDEADVRSMGRPAYGVRGISLLKSDYVVGVAVTPKEHAPGAFRILSVSENGFGKRTDVDQYRLQSRGGKGVKNMAVTPRIGRVNTIQLVDDTSELMVISQFGKIIRVDTKQIRAAGRATQGVHLLNLEADDKVAAAVIIPPEELNGNGNGNHHDEQGTLLQ